MIPYGRQSIDDEDIASVIDALRSDFLTCGNRVEAFEDAFAEQCGAKYAVACSNGTAALHMAMFAAGIGKGDFVATSPITFLASANAAAFVGAQPWFGDIEEIGITLDVESLEESWVEGTKAIVAVDYAGHPADHYRLSKLAESKGAVLIEDACHAVGGSVRVGGSVYKIGGLPWVDMATFSFHPVKTMTTGEGGMLVTNNRHYAEKAKLFRNHGMVRNPEEFIAFGSTEVLSEVGPWAYEMQELGCNYRLTDLQCALGISQLKRLDGFVERRLEIVEKYNTAFADFEYVRTPRVASWVEGGSRLSWHLYQIGIDFRSIGKSRTEVMTQLRELGVGTQVHYIPVSEQPYYSSQSSAELPNSRAFYETTLSLPLFPEMKDEEVETVVESIRAVVV